MSLTSNEIAALAGRVERGEVGAAAELRRLLEGSMGPIVRRALHGSGVSRLDESIRDTARRAAHGETQPAGLVGLVGASLSARIVGRLRAGADSVAAGQQTVVV